MKAKQAPSGKPRPASATRSVIATEARARFTDVMARIDALTAAGTPPVVLLCCDPASSLDPTSRPRVTFIDMTGMPGDAIDNVQYVSSPAFIEIALTRTLQAVRLGARHVIVDDTAMMQFYCGEGPTHAFAHSLAAGLLLADAGCDLFVTDTPESQRLQQSLPVMLG